MHIEFKPRLRHCTLIDDPGTSKTILVVGSSYFELERQTGTRAEFLKLKSLLDGRRSINEISALTGVSVESVRSIVSMFHEAGLLQERTAIDQIAVEEFKLRVEQSSLMWRRQIGLHTLFGGLTEKLYRREVFVGLLVETYHYVKALPRTLKRVASHMTDGALRDCVEQYADEEMDHFLMYEEALRRLDSVGDYIDEAHPTIGTLSLLRNFESIGLRNELGLVCCLQLIEARQTEMESAESHLVQIARNYGMVETVQPYIEHMKADVGMGHADLLSRALRSKRFIDAPTAHEAVNDMHDLKHAFDGFHHGIIEYYADVSNYIPRPRVDFFAL